jgi:hypothetical protein
MGGNVMDGLEHGVQLAGDHEGVLVLDRPRLPVGKILEELNVGEVLARLREQRVVGARAVIVHDLRGILLGDEFDVLVETFRHHQEKTFWIHGRSFPCARFGKSGFAEGEADSANLR